MSDNVPAEIELKIEEISDASKIIELTPAIDAFVNKWSNNPFLLAGFTSQFIKSCRVNGWTPLVLIIKEDEKIIGLAPLMLKKRLGLQLAQFFPKYLFSPDFVVDDRFRGVCIGYFVEYLFKTKRCRFARFNMPTESSNLEPLQQQCKAHGVDFSSNDHSKHCFIPIEGTWDEFQQKKGKHWRGLITSMKNKLDKGDPWGIEYYENVTNQPDILNKIINVERMSWKEAWRKSVSMETDEDLLMLWEGSQIEGSTNKDFKCSVWFLKINSEIVAYTLVIKYKSLAFGAKTSYSDAYKPLRVGKYLMYTVIHDLFNDGQFGAIDFMTDVPLTSFWTCLSWNRVEVSLHKGNLARLAIKLHSNKYVSRILTDING